MKEIRFIGLLVLLMTLVIFSVAQAADSLGSVGTSIMEGIGKVTGGDNALAMALYTAILTVVGVAVRIMLKRMPTVARGVVGKIVWSVLAGLFGEGVVLDNHTDKEYVRRRLEKKFTWLQTSVKSIADGTQKVSFTPVEK